MCRCVFLFVAALLTFADAAQGQQASVSGVVVDLLGARVQGAAVSLVDGQRTVAEITTGADGNYSFRDVASGRYQIVVRAMGFEVATSDPVFVESDDALTQNVTLQVGPLTQAVVVTAAPDAITQSQTGAPVTVIDTSVLTALNKPDVLEALRLVPGAQVHQNGGRGGFTSVFIRGGNSNFAKVLVDGIAANDIGGGFDFAQLATTGVSKLEVLRQANSVLHGTDALVGVISLETPRGSTRVPAVTYSIDGGNLGTFQNTLSFGGAVRRFDYFAAYSFFDTDNKLPNNKHENRTFAGRFGAWLGSGTDISAVIRRIDTESGSPNAFSLYQIADDSTNEAEHTYAGITARSQWTDRVQTIVRFGSADRITDIINPTPTGEAFDPFGFGANYLGQQVMVVGANGYTATGRAILDFGGAYPSLFSSRTTRRSFSGQVSVALVGDLTLSAGGRLEREQGFDDPNGDATTTRDNQGLFVEGRGAIGGRTYASAGLGFENNEAFDPVVTPRMSVATYLRQPALGTFGDTKVSFNAGRGIKAPSVFQVESSLFGLLAGVPNGPAVDPISPEKGTSIDIGVEQGLWDGHARVRVAYFRNSYEDLIEFVSRNVLPQVGVPVEIAQATSFGAYVNSQSYDAQGIEASAEALVANRFRLMASYTFLDAEVTESFSSGALSPAINPAFPGIRIGAFSPLIGRRPFRRPTHSGTFMISYEAGPAQVTLSSYFSGARDDSTFLSDQFFGNSMLLPNQGLAAAYQKFDLNASYALHRRIRPYISVENLFDQEYQAAFGFPSLPRTARVGLNLTVGGN